MTLEERAEKLSEAVIFLAWNHREDEAIKVAALALKEQDKITRHACAEAIVESDACDIDEDGGWEMMSKGDVNREIASCKGGVE